MSGADASLAISVFLASGVEAFTIVLALGSTRGWSSALSGTAVASLVLVAVITVLGPALTVLPIDILRLTVGGLLLIFGLQWLRKAILRAGGATAMHDEPAAFEEERAVPRGAPIVREGIDSYAFAISFKAILLGGLVAFIVLTFGANQSNILLAVK